MKKTLLFLSAVGCLVLPTISHADVLAANGKKVSKTDAATTAVVVPAPKRERVIYYLTTETRTGSLIPMVYRRYGGRIDAASNPGVYGSNSITETGTNDVGTALYKLDSSFTYGRPR